MLGGAATLFFEQYIFPDGAPMIILYAAMAFGAGLIIFGTAYAHGSGSINML